VHACAPAADIDINGTLTLAPLELDPLVSNVLKRHSSRVRVSDKKKQKPLRPCDLDSVGRWHPGPSFLAGSKGNPELGLHRGQSSSSPAHHEPVVSNLVPSL